jgi:hypothetical protein
VKGRFLVLLTIYVELGFQGMMNELYMCLKSMMILYCNYLIKGCNYMMDLICIP